MANPLPKPDARKQRHAVAQHNATRLPVTGRVGRPPKSPVDLDVAGQRWWRWAWSTPQSTQWHKGFMEPLALRASLEDDLPKMDTPADRARVLALMLRIDDAFGLTPKAAMAMHLTFVDEPEPPKLVAGTEAPVAPIRGRLKGMRDQ